MSNYWGYWQMSEVRGVTGEDFYSHGKAGWHMVGPGTGFSTGQLAGYLLGYVGASVLIPYVGGTVWNAAGYDPSPSPGLWPHGDSTHFSTSPGGGGPGDSPSSAASVIFDTPGTTASSADLSADMPGSVGRPGGTWKYPYPPNRSRRARQESTWRCKARMGSNSKRRCVLRIGHRGGHRFY